MLNELVANEAGVYILSFVLAIGVGLVLDADSRAAWLGSMMITAVFVLVASTQRSDTPWVVPLYVVTLGITALIFAMRRFSDSPLLADEPYWRRAMLMLVHPKTVRSASLLKRDENPQESTV